jgi:hypothetical protein
MARSEGIAQLAEALSQAQGEMKNPVFDSLNPHFRSKYASLASVRDAITPALSKHGLSITQLPINNEDGQVAVETTLMHKSGEYVSCTLTIPTAKRDAHGFGAALTYARRYSLQSIVSVSAEEDTDGNEIVAPASTVSPVVQQQQQKTEEPKQGNGDKSATVTETESKPPPVDAETLSATIIAELLEAETVEATKRIAFKYTNEYKTLPPDLQRTIAFTKKARVEEIAKGGK